jgi:hypothetical protein
MLRCSRQLLHTFVLGPTGLMQVQQRTDTLVLSLLRNGIDTIVKPWIPQVA